MRQVKLLEMEIKQYDLNINFKAKNCKNYSFHILFCTFFIFRSGKANNKTNESKSQMQTMRFSLLFSKGETESWLEIETASALLSPRTLFVRQCPQHASYVKELHKLRTDDDGMNSAFCVICKKYFSGGNFFLNSFFLLQVIITTVFRYQDLWCLNST